MSLPVKADITITKFRIHCRIRLLSPQRQYITIVLMGNSMECHRKTYFHFNTCSKKPFPSSHTKNFSNSTTIIRTSIAIQLTVKLNLSTKGGQSFKSMHLFVIPPCYPGVTSVCVVYQPPKSGHLFLPPPCSFKLVLPLYPPSLLSADKRSELLLVHHHTTRPVI